MVICVAGVDGNTGEVEDNFAPFAPAQDGKHSLPKAAAILRHVTEDEMMFLVYHKSV